MEQNRIADSKALATHDLLDFTIRDLTECGIALREAGNNAGSMEVVAGRIVKQMYNSLRHGKEERRACSLVRFYKTHPFQGIGSALQDFANNTFRGESIPPDSKCLILLATAGEEPDWNSRRASRGHQAIPLPSENAIHRIPMISHLLQQLGIPVSIFVNPDPQLLVDITENTFNVFYVPEALNSPHIPAQKDFVVPHKIKSVVGFGGLLPEGEMFAVIIFFRVMVYKDVADMFKTLALNVKLALLPFENDVFSLEGNND